MGQHIFLTNIKKVIGRNKYIITSINPTELHRMLYLSMYMYPGGGGGGVLPYVCILGMCRARDPHFQPWISVPEHIIFTNYQKSVPEHHHFTFFGGFCRSGDHHFQNFFNFNPFIASHGRLSPNAKRSAAQRVSSQPERQPDASWQFRRLAFSRSKRIKLVPKPRISSSKQLKLVPEPRIFTLDPGPIYHCAAAHAYQNLGYVHVYPAKPISTWVLVSMWLGKMPYCIVLKAFVEIQTMPLPAHIDTSIASSDFLAASLCRKFSSPSRVWFLSCWPPLIKKWLISCKETVHF